jgi:hypothetical protein
MGIKLIPILHLYNFLSQLILMEDFLFYTIFL